MEQIIATLSTLSADQLTTLANAVKAALKGAKDEPHPWVGTRVQAVQGKRVAVGTLLSVGKTCCHIQADSGKVIYISTQESFAQV
jgi:hypothetical protein